MPAMTTGRRGRGVEGLLGSIERPLFRFTHMGDEKRPCDPYIGKAWGKPEKSDDLWLNRFGAGGGVKPSDLAREKKQ
jgi:hypothetical protein